MPKNEKKNGCSQSRRTTLATNFSKAFFFSMWHHGDDERHDDDACDGDDGDSGVVLY